ncbi:hypothetical protein [Actinospongicola halichondriae]|uniref:hypothetical protein n=1 Tax=Actinospongicola halichondriae TaxID=3236844 RepID=UPI003D554318
MRFLWPIVALTLFVAACADDGTPVATDDDGGTTAPAAPSDATYTATTTVLESADHGPQLCLGGVAESYPPQCGGPDIVGWDWSTLDAESANGTTWGEFTVVGTWDGDTFTVTEPPTDPVYDDVSGPTDFATPCEAPDGGWSVIDEATATDEGQQAAAAYAQAQTDFAGLWVDQSMNSAATELGMNDPTKLVLNVRFTGDLDRHESELRSRFGGALCVSEAERTEAELRSIQDEVFGSLDAFHASTDIVRGVVEIGVAVADPAVQAELDETYGAGVVELVGALRPVAE